MLVFQLLENELAGVGNTIDEKYDYNHSGMSVSLSSEGTRVVIGSPHHDANATYDTGRVCVFERIVKNANPHANTDIDIGEVLYYDWEEVGSPLDGSSRGATCCSDRPCQFPTTELALQSVPQEATRPESTAEWCKFSTTKMGIGNRLVRLLLGSPLMIYRALPCPCRATAEDLP